MILCRKIFIAIFVFFALLFVSIGMMVGFPWERMRASSTARQYVINTYHLNPTKTEVHFLLDDGTNEVSVFTKELPFSFSVGVSRRDLTYASNDDYLEKLVEYKLSKAIRTDVTDMLYKNMDIYIFMNIGLTRQSPKGLSIEMVKKDPEKAFDKLKGGYYVVLEYDKVQKSNFSINEIDNDTNYKIMKKVLSKYRPSSFEINYRTENATVGRASIDDFNKIQNSKDLEKYFEVLKK